MLDPNLFGDSLPQQRSISSMTHSHGIWGQFMESNTLCNSGTMTYDRLENKQNVLPWGDDTAISTDLDFDLFSATFPMLDDFSELESLGYHPSRRPNTDTPSQANNNQQIFESHYPNSVSSCSRPSFDSSTSRPESAIYPPLSPTNSIESSSPVDFHGLCGSDSIARSVPEPGNLVSEDETDDDSVSSEEPYARLIWRALMSAPGHKMVLKEIYEWFEKNTSKAKNSDSKGWQNSIRHNLSMNAVSKKLCLQELRPENPVTLGFSLNALSDTAYSRPLDTANPEFTKNPKNQTTQPPRGKGQGLEVAEPPKRRPNTDAPSKSLKG
ncbi:uncharacterized protein GIQ15_03422 [Arthroderma uncinatum]|uniref:uncharacterized protein n=1 Tax=Arthroderma uncinatum TaxID=74035 RepID=UPI00144AA042|nr:uncharacterized protein GIQ15_03422 [Arthroderma uncinatum]KAF3484098.1 hypothetical protein GIQ15_03422 [Arthroderma uncinatum]